MARNNPVIPDYAPVPLLDEEQPHTQIVTVSEDAEYLTLDEVGADAQPFPDAIKAEDVEQWDSFSIFGASTYTAQFGEVLALIIVNDADETRNQYSLSLGLNGNPDSPSVKQRLKILTLFEQNRNRVFHHCRLIAVPTKQGNPVWMLETVK